MNFAWRDFKFSALILSLAVGASSNLSIAAPPAVKADAKPKSAPVVMDWYATLRLSELQLTQNKFADGTNTYIKALKAAETAKATCGDSKFIELMAVGNEISVRGCHAQAPSAAISHSGKPSSHVSLAKSSSLPAKSSSAPAKSSPLSALPAATASAAADIKLTEAALKAKEHAAASLCGPNSPAIVEAWQSLFTHYKMVSNNALALEYRQKCMSASSIDKFPESEVYRKAGAARVNAYLRNEFSSIKTKLDVPNP